MREKNTETGGRAAAFARNRGLEDLLAEVNASLWESEQKLLHYPGVLGFHTIFIMGPMRSGTTLFMQWLANTGVVAYPTNLLSRFYRAPIIGAKIQLLLTDPRYSFRDELSEFSQTVPFSSENGKTIGAMSPNEFWYFWRRFLADPLRDVWSDDELRSSFDATTMLAELAGLMDVFQKPFAAKGILFNYNIPYLDSVFDKALFIHLKRDHVSNVASVLNARNRQFGNDSTWYSFKIPEYPALAKLDPVNQVAGQIHYIQQAISQGLENVDASRKIVVGYEDFCANPRRIFEEISEKILIKNNKYSGPERFNATSTMNISNRDDIEKAVARFYEDSE